MAVSTGGLELFFNSGLFCSSFLNLAVKNYENTFAEVIKIKIFLFNTWGIMTAAELHVVFRWQCRRRHSTRHNLWYSSCVRCSSYKIFKNNDGLWPTHSVSSSPRRLKVSVQRQAHLHTLFCKECHIVFEVVDLFLEDRDALDMQWHPRVGFHIDCWSLMWWGSSLICPMRSARVRPI